MSATTFGAERSQPLSTGTDNWSIICAPANANPDVTAEKLATRHIPATVVRDWQDQSTLTIAVPGHRGHDAQILVAAGIRDRTGLSQADIASLLHKVVQVAETTEGKRILRSGAVPDLEEVTAWINAARQSTTSKVA